LGLTLNKKRKPTLKINMAGCGSSGRTPAWQEQGPLFKPQIIKKAKKTKNLINILALV
jgi:hypothetical protein